MGQLELTSERSNSPSSELSSNKTDALTRAVTRKGKRKEPIVFDFSSGPLPQLLPRAPNTTGQGPRGKAAEDNRPASSTYKDASTTRVIVKMDDDLRDFSLATQSSSSMTKLGAKRVRRTDSEQGVAATTAFQLRPTGQELLGLRGPTTCGQTKGRALWNQKRAYMAEDTVWDTAGQNGLWRGVCKRRTQSTQPALVYPLAATSTPGPLIGPEDLTEGKLNVSAFNEARHYNPEPPPLHHALLTHPDVTCDGAISLPLECKGNGNMTASALEKSHDKWSDVGPIRHVLETTAVTSLSTNRTYDVNARRIFSLQDHTDVIPPAPAISSIDKPDEVESPLACTTELRQRSDTDNVPERVMRDSSEIKPLIGACQQALSTIPIITDHDAIKESGELKPIGIQLAESHQAGIDPAVVAQDKTGHAGYQFSLFAQNVPLKNTDAKLDFSTAE
ncbi:hypothetical protein DL546_009914 [Coniochaeta pulveracea]|uniref:Uncharacterized protein n=1 Tax=Coniochaeta pulveracea TaxID=177199 RepID=A0A420YME8_9PEZI|nr:hypothetical protein DL546_009914 [Coniochaeta pulveracea]